MWALGLLILQTIGATPGGGAAQDPPARPMLAVAARGYRTDGRSSGIASDSGPESTTGYVWSDAALCAYGAGPTELSPPPSVGWHFAAHVVQRAGEEFVVRVEWQRLWENSTRIATPRQGDVEVRLRVGDRIELDHVLPLIPSPCQAEILRLEVTITPRIPARGPAVGGASGSGGLIGGGRVSSGGGSGRGGAGVGGAGIGGVRAGARTGATPVLPVVGDGGRPVASDPTPAAAAPTVQSDEDLRLKVEAMLVALQAQSERARLDSTVTARLEEIRQLVGKPRFDAAVWLVHRPPNGTEDVQRLAATFASRAAIAFATVPIATARGTVNVDVTAVLQLSQEPGQPPLEVMITRRVRGDGRPPVDNVGGSDRRMDVPKLDEVLSFELPALIGPTSDLLAGHAFSLRLHIAPASATSTAR